MVKIPVIGFVTDEVVHVPESATPVTVPENVHPSALFALSTVVDHFGLPDEAAILDVETLLLGLERGNDGVELYYRYGDIQAAVAHYRLVAGEIGPALQQAS